MWGQKWRAGGGRGGPQPTVWVWFSLQGEGRHPRMNILILNGCMFPVYYYLSPNG